MMRCKSISVKTLFHLAVTFFFASATTAAYQMHSYGWGMLILVTFSFFAATGPTKPSSAEAGEPPKSVSPPHPLSAIRILGFHPPWSDLWRATGIHCVCRVMLTSPRKNDASGWVVTQDMYWREHFPTGLFLTRHDDWQDCPACR